MSYSIYNSDGALLTNIPIGDIDNFTTSLTLVGKNLNNYGNYLNTNLVKLLTNSASTGTTSPNNPQIGQLWFNKTTNRLAVYDGTSFSPTYGSRVSGVAPTTSTIAIGDFWYDTVNTQLKLWDGDSFNLVGPATSGLLGTFGVVPAASVIRDNITNVIHNVGQIYSHGVSVGVVTTATFPISSANTTILLPNTVKAYSNSQVQLVNGITISRDLEVVGRIYINGWDVQNHPNTDISANYNITPFGAYTATTTATTWGSTNSNLIAYNAANYAISNDLAKMFNTQYYQQGSQVSVICAYNTETSIRSFVLLKKYTQQQVPWWEPNEIFPYIWTSTNTLSNITNVDPVYPVSSLSPVDWAWTSTVYLTNIKTRVWNEVIRTDSTSSTSTTYLNPVTVGSTFFVKVDGGIPSTTFTYAGVAPFTGFAGTATLDIVGAYTTGTIITNTIQPSITTATYIVNFEFNGSKNTRQLSITAVRP